MPDLIDELERLKAVLAEVHCQLEGVRERSQDLTRLFEEAEARVLDTITKIRALHGTIQP